MRLAPALLAVSALSGCTAGRDYTRPEMALSATYHAPVPIAAPDARWWRRFGDPVLDALVDMALAQNLDIAAAAARVSQARAAVDASGAALLPQIDLAASGSAPVNRCARPSVRSPTASTCRATIRCTLSAPKRPGSSTCSAACGAGARPHVPTTPLQPGMRTRCG